jgi:hypothetical protein
MLMMGGVATALALALIALAASCLPARAGAAIVLGEGAAGIHLGDSESFVLKRFGKPYRSEPGFIVYLKKPCLCSLGLRHNRVDSIDVVGKQSQWTSKGVGVGTSYEKTVAAYPEAKCYHPPVYGETSRYCVLESKYKGRAVKTVFAFFEKDLGVRDIEIRFQ